MEKITRWERAFIVAILEKYMLDNKLQTELPKNAIFVNKIINKLETRYEQDKICR